MRDETKWPDDIAGWIFVPRAMQKLAAAGLTDEIARQKIADWYLINSGQSLRIIAPDGQPGTLSPNSLANRDNHPGIFGDGQWWSRQARRPGPESRTFESIRRPGAHCDIYLPSKCLDDIIAPPTSRGGAPSEKYWPDLEREAMRLMDEYGPPSRDNPDLPTQESLKSKLRDFCQAKFGKEPSDASLKRYVPRWIRAFETKARTGKR